MTTTKSITAEAYLNGQHKAPVDPDTKSKVAGILTHLTSEAQRSTQTGRLITEFPKS